MVYEKARSGDPDYDDKQPQEFHAGGVVVSAGDGVILSKSNGPVDENGAHVSLAVETSSLDNRPTPGNVAEATSEVQEYDAEDTPTTGPRVEASKADIDAARAGQASVRTAEVATSGTDAAKPAKAVPARPGK